MRARAHYGTLSSYHTGGGEQRGQQFPGFGSPEPRPEHGLIAIRLHQQ